MEMLFMSVSPLNNRRVTRPRPELPDSYIPADGGASPDSSVDDIPISAPAVPARFLKLRLLGSD